MSVAPHALPNETRAEAGQLGQGRREAEGICRSDVDREFRRSDRVARPIPSIGAPQDPVDIARRCPELAFSITLVGHQKPGLGVFALQCEPRQSSLGRS